MRLERASAWAVRGRAVSFYRGNESGHFLSDLTTDVGVSYNTNHKKPPFIKDLRNTVVSGLHQKTTIYHRLMDRFDGSVSIGQTENRCNAVLQSIAKFFYRIESAPHDTTYR